MSPVRLRPITINDAEICFRWVSDSDVIRYLGLTQPVASEDQERAWIARVLADKQQQKLFIIEDESGRAIGTCGLRGIDQQEGKASFGIMIGDKKRWNQGYGTAATRELLHYAFNELGLREIKLSCHIGNQAALRCYQKAGFCSAPNRRKSLIYAKREVQMTITRERWNALQEDLALEKNEPD